jgi:cyclic pyranopterin phosphate synthase
MARVRKLDGVDFLHITTNGVKTARFLDELQDMRIDGLNLSLDTLDPEKFFKITRRDYLDSVLQTFHGAIKRNIPLKINSVVLDDTSDEEIINLAELAQNFPVTLRFIETMPFSGGNGLKKGKKGYLIKRLSGLFDMKEVASEQPTTARIFELPGFAGRIGIIEGHSRKFCTTCNKLRITPVGTLKTCLYDNGVLDLKNMLRSGADDTALALAIVEAVSKRFINGLEAEEICSRGSEPSMASIGG